MPRDDDDTPAQTPSALLRLGIEPCPACEGRGISVLGEVCFFCEGGRRVSHARADEWRRAHCNST